MYMCVYFAKGDLPWKGLKKQNKAEMNKQMLSLKQNTSVEALCEGLPGEIALLLKYVRGLKFEEDPDYRKMQGLLERAAKTLGVRLNKDYDWVKKMKKRRRTNSIEAHTELDSTQKEEIKAPTTSSKDKGKKKENVEEKPGFQTVLIKGSSEFDDLEVRSEGAKKGKSKKPRVPPKKKRRCILL
eukprot:TRINITY_DN1228_c0_g1_i3.p1 TRINITY_DN1228_c0_g1~~TRINITY_DN1228_c0_g1_i3.p1  ORF type:complete len:184 (+),score=74.17 TRINITY_DN1228_c0_g1_i3:950-1501(+)